MQPSEPPAVLRLSGRIARRLRARAAAALPREACGALLGHRDADHDVITAFVALGNRAEDPMREYRLDPLELEPWMRDDRLLGFYHSHPDGPAAPSASDLRLSWSRYWYLILGRDTAGSPAMGAWRDGRRGILRVLDAPCLP